MPRAKLKTQGEYFMFARNVCGAIAAFTLLLSAPVYGQASTPSTPTKEECRDEWELSDASDSCTFDRATVTDDDECKITVRCKRKHYWPVITTAVALDDVSDLNFCIFQESGAVSQGTRAYTEGFGLYTEECESQTGYLGARKQLSVQGRTASPAVRVSECRDEWELSDAYGRCTETRIKWTSGNECEIDTRCRDTNPLVTSFWKPAAVRVALDDVSDLNFCIAWERVGGGNMRRVSSVFLSTECEPQTVQTGAEVPISSPASPEPGTLTVIEGS